MPYLQQVTELVVCERPDRYDAVKQNEKRMFTAMKKYILLTTMLIMLTNSVSLPDYSGIDTDVEQFKSETGCNSVSVVIYDHGEMTYYGDAKALYQIGSITKSFTGLAIEQLINNGSISENDTVAEFVPGFTAYYDSSAVDISVRNLLMQQSGFTNSETDYPSADEDMSLADWSEKISGRELKSYPGTEYSYSNVNYNLLGLIIEKASGKTYREYMEENVLQPLGLYSTTAGIPEDEEHMISGTRLGFRMAFEYDIPVREGSIPAGYFYSDAEDIGIWMRAWIETEYPEMNEIISHLDEEGDYYAGWERFDGDTIGHSGGTPNYSSRIVFSQSKEIGVCVLTNLNVAASTDSLCNNIFSQMAGYSHGNLSCDVWTVFDIIFTLVSAISSVILIVVAFLKKKGVLIAIGSAIALLLILMFILFPVIFGAGLKDIALVWAPWSLLAGMIIMAADVVLAAVKYCVVKANEGREKTG